MNKEKKKQIRISRRKARVRAKISGTGSRPRLNIFRSNKGMFLQLIDDKKGVTLASAGVKEVKIKGSKKDVSYELGKLIAKKGLEKKIKEVVFDRSAYKYHGRVEMAAKGAREGGLKF
jgi:large subunit ribosomal protein L18